MESSVQSQRKNPKRATDASPPAITAPVRIAVMAFIAVLGLVICLWFYLYRKWPDFSEPTVPTPNVLPPLSEVLQNTRLMFQNYQEGYHRTILGFALFGMMVASFLSFGKLMFDKITKNECDLSLQTNLFERISLYYLFGSVLMSVLWLGLGSVGVLNMSAGLVLGAAGSALFCFYAKKGKWISKLKEKFIAWFTKYTVAEKVLTALIFLTLASLMTSAIRWQTYSDVYQIHLPLPSMYIQNGKIIENPYSIYSYFPQNTEMLVMWALLLKSEVAAALLMWGFFGCLVLLIWGYLKRCTSNVVSLSTVLLCMSAPMITWFSTAIKNDLPTALFILAHYFALTEALNNRSSNTNNSKKWALLSGILCAGAVGHKLTALISAFFSILLLFGLEIYHHLKKSEIQSRTLPYYWLSGFLLFSTPWFLRAVILTGNPIYPFMENFFGGHLVKPWHTVAQVSSSFTKDGWTGLANYFKLLIGTFSENGILSQPNWGPAFLFGLLGVTF